MHPDSSFGWSDERAMLDFVAEAAFVRVFAQTPDGPRLAHAPALVVDGRLRFHLSNRNALTPHLTGLVALAVAEGPNGYVSANWYRDVRGAVPTWNYVAVEVEGRARRLDRDELVTLVDALALRLEPRVAENWTRAKMESPRFEALLGAITGFELDATALRGTRKLSQNKLGDEFNAVVAGLDGVGQHALVAAMKAVRA